MNLDIKQMKSRNTGMRTLKQKPKTLKGQMWLSFVKMRDFALTIEYLLSVLSVSFNDKNISNAG